MSTAKNQNEEKWNQAIAKASELLERVENRAARLKGAIKTFSELRDRGQSFNGDLAVQELDGSRANG